MRSTDPLETAVPAARRVAAAVLILVAGAILVGWVPFDAQSFALTLILIGLGLFV